jgi:hypothetical protein
MCFCSQIGKLKAFNGGGKRVITTHIQNFEFKKNSKNDFIKF